MIEIIIAIIVLFIAAFLLALMHDRKNKVQNETKNEENIPDDYVRPQFKPLTHEQIEDIHSRGKITPAEMVKEWESLDLCAPGDAIGSAAWRCKKFRHCCHDCLVDYANENDEYESFFKKTSNFNLRIDT